MGSVRTPIIGRLLPSTPRQRAAPTGHPVTPLVCEKSLSMVLQKTHTSTAYGINSVDYW